MTDQYRNERKDPKEGVRIIGAEEAAEALERDDVAKRRPEHAPRFGDPPQPPPEGGPQPAIRFPLSQTTDPSEVERSPVAPPPEPPRRPPGDTSMPHWTEPATGEVPKVFASDEEKEGDDLDAWASFTTSQPRWRGESTAYEAEDFDDFSRLADDETRVGALDPRRRPDPDDFFSFDEDEEPEAPPESPRPISSDPRRSATRARAAYERPLGTGRDMSAAIGVGAGLGALLLIFAWMGPRYLMALVTAVIVVAAAEFFNAVRKAGYQPATLLGIAASGALVLASYWKGEVAIPLVLFLTVAFGLIWYLAGAGGNDRPVAGLAITLAGVGYVGLLGAFAALILTLPDGVGILLAAIVGTVGYDLGGFLIGRSTGTKALSEVSPNKTVEGLLGGMVVAVLSVVVVFGIIGVAPLENFNDAMWIGIGIAIAAPLGDLCESLMKRDLGVKDMGDVLPGHGGLLDRFDAMLFVLPTVFYVARVVLF